MANDLSRYYAVREQMRTGDLLTYRTNGAISWAIRRWSPGSNHAGLVLDLSEYRGESQRRWTLEARSHGASMAFLSTLLERLEGECYWHALKPEYDPLRNAIGCYALEQQGVVPYDLKALLQLPFRAVSADVAKLLCSEYVEVSWVKGGIVFILDKFKVAKVEDLPLIAKPSDLPMLGVTLPPIRIVCHKPFVQVPRDLATVNP